MRFNDCKQFGYAVRITEVDNGPGTNQTNDNHYLIIKSQDKLSINLLI